MEAYSDLECEVIWYPGFSSPEAGEFNLCVREGNTINLKCFAKVRIQTANLEKQNVGLLVFGFFFKQVIS